VRSEIELWVRAPARVLYHLAAEVERWPELLPHYRWVRLLERAGNRKLVDMAASRDGIPVSWRAVQELDPEAPRITFRHVKGITRGMAVEWAFREQPGGTLVRIRHELTLQWPLIGAWVADHIIGPQFVERIAGKTLRRMKQLAEAGGRRQEAVRDDE
jgi:ribosome-associated toxin RatA of RatAB toxin-antitoxin module